ncbi:hypothetical protein [Methanosphaera sp. WGK6]|uniref:hypothetical protein n=1 Tax=Methanosphaera sp. WGK6 TaxID=1561964 RepID=UPI00084C339D|nr:hypothetical protein [Methanosphaera sp. WGK6]
MSKNRIIAGVVSFIFTGLGQLYLGFYKRGITQFILAYFIVVLLTILGGSGTGLIIWLLFNIYYAHDADMCCEAINSNSVPPLLFGKFYLL